MAGDTIAVIIMGALATSLPIILLNIEKLDNKRSEYKRRDHITQYKIADKYEEKAKVKVLDILNNLS